MKRNYRRNINYPKNLYELVGYSNISQLPNDPICLLYNQKWQTIFRQRFQKGMTIKKIAQDYKNSQTDKLGATHGRIQNILSYGIREIREKVRIMVEVGIKNYPRYIDALKIPPQLLHILKENANINKIEVLKEKMNSGQIMRVKGFGKKSFQIIEKAFEAIQ